MSTQTEKRQELGLTQTEAAKRAGVSVPTWRRWEADPNDVSGSTAAKCQQVLDREPPSYDWSAVEVWRDHPVLTPRQAAMLISELHQLADLYLTEWVRHQYEPLHEMPPFDQLDRRALFRVGENKAWVAEAADRCHAVADLIESGALPHDRPSCFFDEFVVFAACNLAEETYSDNLGTGLFDRIPPREEHGVDGEEIGDDWTTGDEDWEMLAEWLVDESAWDVQAVCGPRGQLSLLAEAALSRHDPLTWFDLNARVQAQATDSPTSTTA